MNCKKCGVALPAGSLVCPGCFAVNNKPAPAKRSSHKRDHAKKESGAPLFNWLTALFAVIAALSLALAGLFAFDIIDLPAIF
ncbi:MAG: hypothetical protein J6L81_04980 [Clostridia bacterium]|nr:hypothetical protein [Clostridia bacterium]